jgi:hypothetical protein
VTNSTISPIPYVFRVRVPFTKARPLRRYLGRQFPVVLTDESRWRVLWRVFTVEAPPEMLPGLRRKVESKVGADGIVFD